MTITPNQSPPTFESFVLLELMGHRRHYGFAREVDMFGGRLLRIDIHEGEAVKETRFYGASAIFCMTPVPREIVVARTAAAPPPPMLAAPTYATAHDLCGHGNAGYCPECEDEAERA